jgi:hypothetical protein
MRKEGLGRLIPSRGEGALSLFNFGGFMNLRETLRGLEKEYQEAFAKAKKMRPEEEEFELADELGGELRLPDGCLVYTPSDDTVRMSVQNVEIKFSARYLPSLYSAVKKLLEE